MRRFAGLALAAATIGAVLVTALPASAETRSFADRPGDAPAFLDVTRLKVTNAHTRLTIRATVPGFDPATLDMSLTGTGDEFGALSLYLTVKGADPAAWTPRWNSADAGRFVVDVGPAGVRQPIDTIYLSRKRGANYDTTLACTGLDATVQAGSITASIPQSCFRRVSGAGSGAVKVKAVMRGNVGPTSREDRTYTTPWVHKVKSSG